jgi:hypothetical protein
MGWLGPSDGSVMIADVAKAGFKSPLVVITRNTVNKIRKMDP